MDNNEKSEHRGEEKDKPSRKPNNPHDRCCRATAFNQTYAPDFLKNYGSPLLEKYLDLDHLRQAPTIQLNKELKEVQLDSSLITRLSDPENHAEVFLHLEHKSQPSTAAAIQLLMEAASTIHAYWINAGRPEKGFVPPIILMIVVYHGPDKWVSKMSFQEVYDNLPPELRAYAIQFEIIVINLRRFDYDNLPGELYTQAYVESLLRAMDGTFNEHFLDIMRKVAQSNLPETGQEDLAYTLAAYNSYTTKIGAPQIIDAISTAFKERNVESNMAERVQKTLIEEGIEIGEERGKKRGIEIGIKIGEERNEKRRVREKAEAVLTVLRTRFKQVPQEVSETISQMSDPTALDSLLIFAVTCASVEDFADSLK